VLAASTVPPAVGDKSKVD